VKKKVIFWGTPEFSIPSLEACFEHSEVLAVVTQPDKPKGRGHELLPTPVKEWALKKKIKVFAPRSLRKLDDEGFALVDFLNKNSVDYFVVVAYGNLFPQSFLDMPKVAAVNVHASLLPRWRGAAPVQRSLESGDTVTGVCLQKMVAALDAGDVLLEKRYVPQDEDNAHLMFQKLAQLGGDLLKDFLKNDFSVFSPQKQDESLVTLAPKITKDEALFNFKWTSKDFVNRVRAFFVWPTVKLVFLNESLKTNSKIEVKILSAKVSAKNFSTSWGVEGNLAFLKCSDSFVIVEKAQLPGKGPLTGELVFQKLLADGFKVVL
jgi:methionyl-tRNA formyltransferase